MTLRDLVAMAIVLMAGIAVAVRGGSHVLVLAVMVTAVAWAFVAFQEWRTDTRPSLADAPADCAEPWRVGGDDRADIAATTNATRWVARASSTAKNGRNTCSTRQSKSRTSIRDVSRA